jgi:hypothetical protein
LPETFNLDDMRLTPLQLATGLTAINNQGEMVKPEYILEIKNPDGLWEKYPPEGKKEIVFNDIVAHKIIESLSDQNFPLWRLTSIETTVDGTQITWFIGGTTSEAEYNYVAVVVLEEENELLANKIGKALLSQK